MIRIFIFLLLTAHLFAYNSIELLNPNIIIKNSGFFISDTKLTPQEAKQKFGSGEFQKFSQKIYGGDLDSREYWYGFEVVIKDQKNSYFIDNLDPALLDSSLYVFKDGKIIREENGGYLLPSLQKSIDSKSIRFSLESSSESTIYLIKSNSVYPRISGFVFGNNDDLDALYLPDYLFYVLLSGSIFTILLYNIFIYFSTKDISYLYYVLYLFLFWVSGSLTKGYDFLLADYVVDYAQYQPMLFMITLQIFYFGLMIFTEKFLILKEKHPKVQKVVRIFFYLNGMFIFLVALNSPILNILSQFFSTSLNTSLLVAAIISFKKGHKPALFYLLATGGMLLMMYIYIAMTKGVFAYNIYTANLMLFSVWWDAVLLSFALAYRINVLQEEKAQKDLLLTMQSRHSAIGEFAGNVAHQWRQPLAQLSSHITKLKMNLWVNGRISAKELKEHIDSSNKIVQHLSNTINTFQGFFTTNESEEAFSVSSEIKRCVDFVKDSMQEQGILLTIEIKNDCLLKGDPNEFAQVILNLLSNAKDALIQSTRKDKKIVISLESKETETLITIEDNGGGIKIEPLEKIFEPYITTKGLNGVGIGLFIVKKIIEQRFGGTVTIVNGTAGAVFAIKLPYSHALVVS